MARRPRCYIAGPLTGPNQNTNIHLAIRAAARLRRAGFAPIVPHLMVLWEIVEPDGATYEDWMDLCLTYLETADVVLRLPGESPGADREVAFAQGLSIAVFRDEVALVRAYRGALPV